MSSEKRKTNPTAFIAIGICYMGAGVALAAALNAKGASVVGIGLIGVGVAFLVIGVTQKRKIQPVNLESEDQDQPSV